MKLFTINEFSDEIVNQKSLEITSSAIINCRDMHMCLNPKKLPEV